jgi:hypothetical protein
MKRMPGILLSLAALAALALGLFLPDVIVMQSRETALRPEQYKVEMIRLETAKPLPVPAALRLVSGEHKTMNLESGRVLDAEGAYMAVRDALSFIADCGLPLEAPANAKHSETPVLLYAEDGEDAAVVWQCELADTISDRVIQLQIDDATGTMLSFLYIRYIDVESEPVRLIDRFPAELWADMCRQYYGFQSVEVGITSKVEKGDGLYAHYDLKFTDETGESFLLPYRTSYLINKDGKGEDYRDVIQMTEVSFNGQM